MRQVGEGWNCGTSSVNGPFAHIYFILPITARHLTRQKFQLDITLLMSKHLLVQTVEWKKWGNIIWPTRYLVRWLTCILKMTDHWLITRELLLDLKDNVIAVGLDMSPRYPRLLSKSYWIPHKYIKGKGHLHTTLLFLHFWFFTVLKLIAKNTKMWKRNLQPR